MDKEVWRWVVGYEGLYMVSNKGRVMSVPRIKQTKNRRYGKSGMEIAHHDNGNGYRILTLSRDGVHDQRSVHRLVAEAFIPNPSNLPEVNHKDGDKANNQVENLEWVTKSENMQHASRELDALGFNRTLTEEQVIAIRNDARTEREIGNEYGLAQSVINRIRVGKTYKSYGGPIQKVGRSKQRKLTREQVIDIRTGKLSGIQLAEKYGVATSTISKIKNGKRYKEII